MYAADQVMKASLANHGLLALSAFAHVDQLISTHRTQVVMQQGNLSMRSMMNKDALSVLRDMKGSMERDLQLRIGLSLLAHPSL